MKPLSRNQWIAVAVALFVVVLFIVLGSPLDLFSTQSDSSMQSDTMSTDPNAGMNSDGTLSSPSDLDAMGDLGEQATSSAVASTTPPATELQITDTIVGTGPEVKAGDTVTVNYVGKFTNGEVFDASASHGQPFSFTVGADPQQVISGWDVGVRGMKVGGKRHLVVPPLMGYGPQDYGPIPGNSTLVFDIELLKIGQ